MGDRANVRVDGAGSVYLYTHWSGSELPETLQRALMAGTGRWNDPPYLARIIFCEMVAGAERSETGFGISGNVGDGDNRVLIVDCKAGTVTFPNEDTLTFEEYINIDDPVWRDA